MNDLERLPKGARRALLAMTGDWQFPGKTTFNANAASNLTYHCRDDPLVQPQLTKDGRHSRVAYRLTPRGIALKEAAHAQ